MVTTWVLLGVRVLSGEVGGFDTFLDWLYVVFLGGGLVLAAIGVAAIRTRGEPLLAVVVLAFSLVLPALYLLFSLLIESLFDDVGFD